MPRTQLLSGSSGHELKIPCASREELISILRQDYPFISRTQIAHWLREGRFRSEVKSADELFLALTGVEAQVLRSGGVPAPCPHCAELAPIRHEDREWLVLDKPAGLPSRPALLSDAHSALHAALAHDARLASLPEQGLLHRIDTGTSGLLAFARTQAAYDRLRALWTSGSVEKIYVAIVSRPPSLAPCKIDLEIAHSAKSAKRMLARLPAAGHSLDSRIRGRWLAAHTEILEVGNSPDGDPTRALVRVRISTGVRHQIRVHLAAIGAPIVGDTLYSKVAAPRLMLHASELSIGGIRVTSPARFNVA